MAKLDASPYPDDLNGELVVQPRKALSKVTLGLIAGVVLVAGVVIGIQVQKALGAPATAAAGQQAGGARQGMPGGYGQQPGGRGQMPGGYGQRMGGAGGAGTVGTVEKVEGGKIYVKTMDGTTVTVTTTDATTVQVTKPGKLADLQTGTNVVVRGEKGGDGSVAATSISQGGGGR